MPFLSKQSHPHMRPVRHESWHRRGAQWKDGVQLVEVF